MMKFIEGKKIFIPVILILFGYIASQISATGGYITALPYLMAPTAHFAFVFFFFAFTASSLARLAPGVWPRFLMRNRRYLGLSFALIHIVHGALVLSNLMLTEASREWAELAGGGLAYALLIAMAITSNNASVRTLGAKRWKLLHKIGSYYLWLIFTGRTTAYALSGQDDANYWIPVLGFVALGLRIAATIELRKQNTKK